MSNPSQTLDPVIVIGGGIAGLTCAYSLRQSGIPVRVLEAGNRPGGLIATDAKDGFLFELGPQSFLSTEPLIELIDSLGIKDQVLHADRRAPRYIVVRGRLVQAPLAPPSLLTTPLFSASTKWRLFTEAFRTSHPPTEDESIAAFVRRKFGDELLQRLVAPFVSGVYAGDPEKLSMRASFPKVHEFEEKYGSVLRGAMKSARAVGVEGSTPPNSYDAGGRRIGGLCSFREGMGELPQAMAASLGSSLLLETRAVHLSKTTANATVGFEVAIERQGRSETVAASAVIVATPTQAASRILAGFSNEFPALLSRIEYAPIAVLSAGYRREQVQRSPDGFGFLVPRAEGLRALGTVFNSSLFPGRAPEGMICLTSFAGGATDPEFCRQGDDEITDTICSEVAGVLDIQGMPVTTSLHRYERALPQYNLGHATLVGSLQALAAAMPGLFLAGNYLSGPSIGACVDHALRTAEAVRAYLQSIGVASVGAVARV